MRNRFYRQNVVLVLQRKTGKNKSPVFERIILGKISDLKIIPMGNGWRIRIAAESETERRTRVTEGTVHRTSTPGILCWHRILAENIIVNTNGFRYNSL